ncbi:serine/threonine-protein kinase SMG1 isoform X2 [Hydra vulgaris]|uniref:serine/threonine-protein kinase SMG1 isoform X2 n=1 Tax=Hydra vulgaris TaxID=6087 RepID=UPI0032EA8D9C
MSGTRSQQNSSRPRKTRRDNSPSGKREKSGETRRPRSDHDRLQSDSDLYKQDERNKDERDKERKRRDVNSTKVVKRLRSPRQLKETNSLKSLASKKDPKLRNEIKEKVRPEKKPSEIIERFHPLFQDNSRLAQLISQITNTQDDISKRISTAQAFLDFIYDAAQIEPLKRNCSNIFSALEEVFRERGNNELKDKIVQCYASVGHVLGIDCDKFFQWIFSKIPSAVDDQLRALYLSTIAQAIKLDIGKQVFLDTMPMIMASLQDVLENADAPDLLIIILDILKIVAHDYPHIFSDYFRDAVDILVGWHIDVSQNDLLIEKTADCLVSFHPYWVSDMRFSLTLLGQFLEDMEAYAEELGGITNCKFSKEDTPSPLVSLSKLTALTGVFTTVVTGLGEYFSPGREAKITGNYVVETVDRIIHCVDICGYDLKYEKLLSSANKCLTVLVGLLGHNISMCCVKLVGFVNSQLGCNHYLSYDLLKSALHLIEIITNVGQSLPMGIIPELLQPKKPLMTLRCHVDPDILKIILKIFQTLLSIKNIPFLEAVYKYVVDDIKMAYNILVRSVSDQEISSETKVEEESISTSDAYCIVIFDLSALAEIATFKSSVTGAWRVDPTTYSLLTESLDPTDEQLVINYPAVQFSILSCLFVHSQRCNHFIPSSKTKSAIHSFESQHLIKMLCKISTSQFTSVDTKCLCSIWLSDIINSIAALPMDLQKRQWNVTQVVNALVVLSYDVDQSIRDEIANSIIKVTSTGLINPIVLGKLLAECLPHLTNKNLQEKYFKMILTFPADILASLPTVLLSSNKLKSATLNRSLFVTCKNDLWLLCKQHMLRAPSGTMHTHAFKIVMRHLLQPKESKEANWSGEHIYLACQRLGKVLNPVCAELINCQRFSSNVDTAFPLNATMFDGLVWFWLIWEAANFCIIYRLKTPLGKALDTFQAIEGALKELDEKFREKNNLESGSKKNKNKTSEKSFEDFPREVYMKQAFVLLLFLENLEKLMYNAYEGTAISLPPCIRAVRTFFRTNRSTCCEWLSRIQESVTVLANMSGNPEKAVRNGYLWLQSLKNSGNTQGSDFEHAIVTVVDSLMQLHCYESIYGVLEWSRKVVGRYFFWLYGATTKAKGSLESAAEQFKSALAHYLLPDRLKEENINETKKTTVTVLTKDPAINADPLSTQFLVSQTADCYLQLCDWTEVQKWNQHVMELKRKYPSLHGLHTTIDLSYVKAMMKFEDHDFAGVHEQLEMIPGATMSNMLQEQFPVLGTVKEEKGYQSNSKNDDDTNNLFMMADGMSPQAMLCQSRIFLMQALTLYWTSGLNTLKGSRVGSLHSSAWETVDNLLYQANKSATIPLQTFMLNNSLNNSASFLMQLKSIAAIREALMSTEAEQDSNVTFMNVYGQTPYIDAHKTDICLLNEALRTASYLQFHHTLHKKGWVGPAVSAQDKLPNVQTIQTMTAKLARIQGNKKLAESLLAKQLSMLESKGAIDGKMYLTGGAQLKLKQLSASVNSGKVIDHLATVDILKESAKLKRTLGNYSEAIDVLCSSILLSERQLLGSNSKSTNIHGKLSEISSRSFVTLAKWILTEPRFLTSVGEADDAVVIGPKVREVLKIVTKSGGIGTKLLQNSFANNLSMSEGDVACGQLLYHSTYRCSTLGKTWFAYADWCYKWGRKAVEKESMFGSIDLLEEEKEGVVKILPQGIPPDVVEKIIGILSKAHCAKEYISEEDDMSSNVLSYEDSSSSDEEKLNQQLLNVAEDYLKNRDDTLKSLLGIWKNIIDRVFTHYRQAASAYFTYLKLSGTESITGTEPHKHCEYGNITATLRLLRLLVKYSGELKQHLETSFEQTPTKPWKGIIPQLFARLNHPEPYVQKCVANLLCRLAKDSPQSIVYQTVVGCSDIMPQQQISKTSAAGILRAYHYQGDDECEQPVEEDISCIELPVEAPAPSQEDVAFISIEERVMQSSLHTILDALNEDDCNLVQEVKCVVSELRRITLLWDELWLGSLTQLHQEAQRRMSQLDTEIKRVNVNQTLTHSQKQILIKEKHTALMRPLIYALERLQKITSQVPETAHERMFQANFASQIDKAIDAVKNPIDPSKPELNWENVKQLYQTLQIRAQKHPMSNLKMEELSPILTRNKFSLVPMPGIDQNVDQEIRLQGFRNEIQILPTKTKPKKLIMIGSDGQQYPYLFKGLEDLHLDERIMQFLEICNHMFSKEDRANEQRYYAQHYSVTPLGPRSGLIQWVDGATPLFTLYRRWQQRESASQAIMKNQGDKNVQNAVRPTELFYNKVMPFLKEKGLDSNLNRKEWPLSVLRKTFQELCNDTPDDLLSRELWCSSANSVDWWKMTQTYSRSIAVMSMIGYVIGLGDRHLDNILVDLTTGEVIHIDYNVCFEKGKALRVPEKVPFRMTRNMQVALGVVGVEGIFRNSCEKVMQTLRQGREILLTLLEAFVYDPLVDWTIANDAAFAGAFYGGGGPADETYKYRKEMERGITQTLLSTRVAEMKVSWSANRDELTSSLNTLKGLLENYCSALNSQWYSYEEVVTLKHQASLLKAALSIPDHPLHSLQSRYDKQAKLLSDLKHWKDKITSKLSECEKMQNDFEHVFLCIHNGSISSLYPEVCKVVDTGPPCYLAAVDFLNSAGQSNIVVQGEQIEMEIASTLNQRRLSLRSCLDTVVSYSSFVSQFSASYVKHSSLSNWIYLLNSLLNESSLNKCKEVIQSHQDYFHRRKLLLKEIESSVIGLENKLHQYFTEQNNKIIKLYERRNHERAETSLLSGPVTETWNALRKFNGDAGTPGAISLACVTVTALSTLNKRQLVMENAAAVAGDRLMHLTSRDGDWFLDELCTMCSNINQLLSVLKNNPLKQSTFKTNQTDSMDGILCSMQVVGSAVKAYNSLQELMSNFRSIIVPEAVKSFLNNDSSVLYVTETINQIVQMSSVSLLSLCEQFHMCFKEKIEVPEDLINIVNGLKNHLDQLTEAENIDQGEENSSSSHMSPGQMLLACFSGLFTKVEVELMGLYEAYRKVKIPSGFDDLNQDQRTLQFSKNISLSSNCKWASFLFLKKLITIQTFFDACLHQSTATREINISIHTLNSSPDDGSESGRMFRVFNEELLCLPVKQFIAECVQCFLVGLPSQAVNVLSICYASLLAPSLLKDIQEGRKFVSSMEELCKKVVEVNLKSNSFPHQHLSQAGTLINAHDVAWRKHDLSRRLDASISAQKDVVQRAQQQLARYQWLNEEILFVNGRKRNQPLANPTKASIINDIKKRMTSINQVEQCIPGLMEKYNQLQSSIEQRLKWASGANPALHSVLKNFDDAVTKRKNFLLSENKLFQDVINLASSIIAMETYKANFHESDLFDQAVVSSVVKFKESCEAFETCMDELGDVEQFMNSLKISMPPHEPITIDWMKARLEKIETQMKSKRAKDPIIRNAIQVERENLKMELSVVKASFTSHHALVGEVKAMLKTLAKDEEAEECLNVRKFIQAHNKFSDDSSIVLKKILNLSSTNRIDVSGELVQQYEDDSRVTVQMIEELITSVKMLHDQLLLFGMSNLKSESEQSLSVLTDSQLDNGGKGYPAQGISNLEGIKPTLPLAISNTNIGIKNGVIATTPRKLQGNVALARDPKTGKALQEKNTYALNVWKRVKAKLEGRDIDNAHRLSVSEQVSHVIDEAIDLDNLCQLYEGWTPWV